MRAPARRRAQVMAAGRWPLAAGRWPLAAGRWPLAAGRWPLAAGRWPLAAGRWPLAAGRWPLAAGRWQIIPARSGGRCQGPNHEPGQRPGSGGRGRLAGQSRIPVRGGGRQPLRHLKHGLLPSTARADAVPPARGRRCPLGPQCARERRQMHPLFDKASYDCRVFPSSQAKYSASGHKRWCGRPVRPPCGATAARQHRGSAPPGRPAVHRGGNGARHPLGYLLRCAVRSFACRPGEPSVACPFAGAKHHRRFVCIRLALQRLSSPCGPLPRHLDALATQVGETLRQERR